MAWRRLSVNGGPLMLVAAVVIGGCGTANGSISGTVTLYTGPVPVCSPSPCGLQRVVPDSGAVVIVQDNRGTIVATTHTGADGRFDLSVPAGRYVVRLQGVDTATTDVLSTVTSGAVTTVHLSLSTP
jgi:hypothetical protein